jgi:hypothetical protein
MLFTIYQFRHVYCMLSHLVLDDFFKDQVTVQIMKQFLITQCSSVSLNSSFQS